MGAQPVRRGVLRTIFSSCRAALATASSYLFAYLFTFVMVCFAIVASVLGLRGVLTALVGAWAHMLFWFVGRRLHVRGGERIEKTGRYLVVANHSSMFDIPAVLGVMPGMAIMGREKLLRIPVFGFFLRCIRYIPIERESFRRAPEALGEAVSRARDGMSVGMFPEGTRTVDGEVQRLKRGFVRILRQGGLDLLPLRIDGTWALKPKTRWYMDPREPIVVTVRQPIANSRLVGMADDEIVEIARQQISRDRAV